MPKSIESFAIVAPGLEPLAAAELAGLGVKLGQRVTGGLEFGATIRQLYQANLQLRTVSRVVVRVARFRATAFWELEKQARKVPWEHWIRPGGRISFSVAAHKSRLYHQRGIAERLFEAVAGRVGEVTFGPDEDGRGRTSEDEGGAPSSSVLARPGPSSTQLLLARLDRDQVVLSADSSGALLHQRGYRLETAKAPLRETLAAALLLGAGWDGSVPLLDPFCGSGTIPIEAALLALRIPPGWGRSFAFEQWPGFDPAEWAAVRRSAEAGIREETPAPILGSDRDAGAVAAAAANAERAGVAHATEFRQSALSRVTLPPGNGWLITNPPYGVRVGSADRLRDLYARLGQVIRRTPGWSAGLLVSDRRLAGHAGLRFREVWASRNGGIPVRFLVTGEGVSA